MRSRSSPFFSSHSVDYYPYGGPYTNTKITNNNIVSKSSVGRRSCPPSRHRTRLTSPSLSQMIKIGMAVGTLSWGSYNSTDYRTSVGIYSDNVFSSGNDGYFGFGM